MSKIFPDRDSWERDIETHWHSPEGFFKCSPEEAALRLKHSHSNLEQALDKIDMYVDTVGKKLDEEDLLFLEEVKERIKGLYQ